MRALILQNQATRIQTDPCQGTPDGSYSFGCCRGGITVPCTGGTLQDVINWYSGKIPTCGQWDYIHSTISQAIAATNYTGDAGVAEDAVRAHYPTNTPCTTGTTFIYYIDDANTRQPIQGATVSLYQSNILKYTVQTDWSGAAIFNNTSSGDYTLKAVKSGYNDASIIVNIPSSSSYTLHMTPTVAPTSVTIAVTNKNPGYGHIDVFRNGTLIASVTNSQSIAFNTGDSFNFNAIGDNGGTFIKFCNPTTCVTTNPFYGTVSVSGSIDAYFTTPAPTGVFTLSSDKTSINSGDSVTFTGKYKPNVTVGIYDTSTIGRLVWIKQGQTDSSGNFNISTPITGSGDINIQACEPSTTPGVCSYIYDTDKSNIITIHVAAPSAVTFTLAVDKTEMVSGDSVTFTGKYKPNVTVGIYDTGISGKLTWTAKGTSDSSGNFRITAELKSDKDITITYQACEPSSIDPLSCSLVFDTDKSNTVTVHITVPKFILKADKSSVSKKGTVTFSGSFEPNIDINIWTYGTAGIKTHIASVKTDNTGAYSVAAVIDLSYGSYNIQSCNASSVPGIECAIIGSYFSNIVPLTVCPSDPIGTIMCGMFGIPPPPLWP